VAILKGQHGHRGQDCSFHNLHIDNMDNTYNGWRNRATWAIGLHLMDTVVSWINDDLEEWSNGDDLNVIAAGRLFQDLVDEQLELADLPVGGLILDLVDQFDIDWCALGQHALDASDVPALVPA
jgi:hypothetical protein